MDAHALAELLPIAAQWMAEQQALVLQSGEPLSSSQVSDAKQMGVQYPARVRLLKMAVIPFPSDPRLRDAAARLELITPDTRGMTLQYAVWIRADEWKNREIVAHELVHVGQFERLGGILPFLTAYVNECAAFRYWNAPMEREARERSERLVRGHAGSPHG